MSSVISDADLVVIYQFDFDVQKDKSRLAVDKDRLRGTFTSLPGGDCWELKLTRTDVNCKSEFHCQLRLNDSRSDWKLCRIGVVSESEGRQIPVRSATEEAVVFTVGREFSLGTFDIDKFSWQVRVEVLKWIGGTPIRSYELPDSTLYDDRLKWFKSEQFGDVTIVAADGKKFRCHRDILARRSEVFRQMFNSGNNDKRETGETSETPIDAETLNIEDFNEEIVAQLIMFVYTDDLDEIGPTADRLYVAADQYKLDRLKSLCESALADNLSEENLAKTQQLAERYDMAGLVKKCVDYQVIHKSEGQICAEEPSAKRPRHTEPTGVSITSKILPIRIAPGSILIDNNQGGNTYMAGLFDRLPAGKFVDKFFTQWRNGDRWELRLEKTDDNDVKRQLRLVHTRTDTPKFAYLTCEKNSLTGGEEEICQDYNTTPMGLFIHSGDTVEFDLLPSGFVDEIITGVRLVESQLCVADPHADPKPPKSQLTSDLLKWFGEENFGDVTIVAKNGKKFRCHRDILARRSDVFRQMFDSARNVFNKTSKTPIDAETLNIEDFNEEIVAQLLLFCYVDECGQIGSIVDRLYVAADWYKPDRLKSFCESTMAANLSDQSMVDTYRFASVYQLDKLMAECVDYGECHRDEICMADLLAGSVGIRE